MWNGMVDTEKRGLMPLLTTLVFTFCSLELTVPKFLGTMSRCAAKLINSNFIPLQRGGS
jgi:hypothetical protein